MNTSAGGFSLSATSVAPSRASSSACIRASRVVEEIVPVAMDNEDNGVRVSLAQLSYTFVHYYAEVEGRRYTKRGTAVNTAQHTLTKIVEH